MDDIPGSAWLALGVGSAADAPKGGTAEDPKGGTAEDPKGGTAEDPKGGTSEDPKGAAVEDPNDLSLEVALPKSLFPNVGNALVEAAAHVDAADTAGAAVETARNLGGCLSDTLSDSPTDGDAPLAGLPSCCALETAANDGTGGIAADFPPTGLPAGSFVSAAEAPAGG